MFYRLIPSFALLALSFSPARAESAQSASADDVSITADGKAVEVVFQKKTVLRYLLTKPTEATDSKSISPSACYFHPLTTPSGVVLTDVGPDDHPHHRGAFCAWLEVRDAADAADFWGWGQYAPLENRMIRNAAVESVSATGDSATFTVKNDWLAGGTALVRENLRTTVTFRSGGRVLDLDWRFETATDVTLPRHAFSGFVVRTRKDAAITAADPAGPVKLPPPSHLKPENDWPSKPWYALELALKDGTKAGAAIVNHPGNPKTLWHIVTGIGMLNPCITAPGPVTVKAGEPLRLRYRVVTFDGAVPTELLNQVAAEWDK
ncbi:MAG: hypothetical protein JWM59_1569 [Verrucomicrobiales bacterium]|nr:hypothetical protein [Verrucomicrobiales bacterium]